VFIEGARPGDVLKVTLLSFVPSGWVVESPMWVALQFDLIEHRDHAG
jgi:acetamidase/formamidase